MSSDSKTESRTESVVNQLDQRIAAQDSIVLKDATGNHLVISDTSPEIAGAALKTAEATAKAALKGNENVTAHALDFAGETGGRALDTVDTAFARSVDALDAVLAQGAHLTDQAVAFATQRSQSEALSSAQDILSTLRWIAIAGVAAYALPRVVRA